MPIKNIIDPAVCWELKSQGFKQPKPAPGQYWFNLLDYPFVLLEGRKGELIARNLWTGYKHPFSGIASEGMVYSPTIEEYNAFKNQQHHEKT